jgi:hypothetical protein
VGLIHELLPATDDGDLPLALLRKRYPAMLLETRFSTRKLHKGLHTYRTKLALQMALNAKA